MSRFVLQADNRARVHAFIDSLPADRPWLVEIVPYSPRRSTNQNSYLWGVVYKTFLEESGLAEQGWRATELHDYMLGEHFGWETLEGLGVKRVRPVRRSSRLSKVEFMDFVDFVIQKAAEHGVYIPEAK